MKWPSTWYRTKCHRYHRYSKATALSSHFCPLWTTNFFAHFTHNCSPIANHSCRNWSPFQGKSAQFNASVRQTMAFPQNGPVASENNRDISRGPPSVTGTTPEDRMSVVDELPTFSLVPVSVLPLSGLGLYQFVQPRQSPLSRLSANHHYEAATVFVQPVTNTRSDAMLCPHVDSLNDPRQ